jgi:hypothetical protein
MNKFEIEHRSPPLSPHRHKRITSGSATDLTLAALDEPSLGRKQANPLSSAATFWEDPQEEPIQTLNQLYNKPASRWRWLILLLSVFIIIGELLREAVAELNV